MQSNGSRWGVKGSSEVSEGLNAVYLYEENLDLGTATLGDGNRLSFVGLSGGFGSLTAGRIWSATYNHVGGVTDRGIWSGNSGHATVRTSNTVSYAASTGPISFQLDMQMDPDGQIDDKSVDMAQFGMSIDTGFATVGLAAMSMDTRGSYVFRRMPSHVTPTNLDGTPGTVLNGNVGGVAADPDDDRFTETMMMRDGKEKVSAIAASIPIGGFDIYAGWHEQKTTTDGHDVHTYAATGAGVDNDADLTDDNTVVEGDSDADTEGNQPTSVPTRTVSDKRTLFGISGPLGDTGMTFAVNFADHDDGTNPWNFHVARSLGGGASVAFEHINADTDMDNETQTLVQLQVDF